MKKLEKLEKVQLESKKLESKSGGSGLSAYLSLFASNMTAGGERCAPEILMEHVPFTHIQLIRI